MKRQMTKEQQELLYKLAEVVSELGEQCELDDNFHEIMIDNNDLFPMCLYDWSSEWNALAEGVRGEEEEKEEGIKVIGFYKSNKEDFPSHTTEKLLYFVVFENGYEDGSKTWLEGYNVIDGHFELKDNEYLSSCERITKEEYLKETEGLYTPVEYL